MSDPVRARSAVASRVALLALLCLSACGGSDDAEAELTLAGALARPGATTQSQLQALPATTQTVSYASGSGAQTHTYVGTSAWGVLNNAGLQLDATRKNDVLNRYVVATGSDGYKAVYALGELDPDFGNQPNLIAYAQDGAPLATTGFARIVVPNDVKAGRWVSNLIAIEVVAAAP